jgi:predicted Zn-dependent protease
MLAPYYASSWYTLGTILGVEGSERNNHALIKQAEYDVRTSIKNGPYNPAPYEILGYLYLNYNSPALTCSFLDYAVVRFPTDYKLWLYLGQADNKKGEKKSAVHALRTAYALNPQNSDVVSAYNEIVK